MTTIDRTNATATAVRIKAPSGNRDNDHWQAACGACPWKGALYSNRTVEGRTLADRDATGHRCADPVDVEMMHRSPTTDALHYGTRADCRLNACVVDRASQTYAAQIASHVDLAAASNGGQPQSAEMCGDHDRPDPCVECRGA